MKNVANSPAWVRSVICEADLDMQITSALPPMGLHMYLQWCSISLKSPRSKTRVYVAMTVIFHLQCPKFKMDAECYSLSDVLAIASVHPFYSLDVDYPPTREELPSVLAKAKDSGNGELLSFPLTHKEQLYCNLVNSPPMVSTDCPDIHKSHASPSIKTRAMATDLAHTSAQRVEVQEDRRWSLRLIQLKLVGSALRLVH